MAKKGNFYSIGPGMRLGQQVVELRIYDEIGFWGKTAAQFVEELDAAAATGLTIVVAINSGGGSVYDAFAMYNALRRYSGRTVGRVDSVAASAATLPLIACDTIEMPENAQIMIHEPTTIARGTLKGLKASVAQMENILDSVIAAYVRRSGQTTEKIFEMMEATTWMSALEAQAMGFCDVIEDPVEIAMSLSTRELLSRYPHIPEPLQSLVEGDDEPAKDPERTPNPDPAKEPASDPAPDPAPSPDPAPAPEPPTAAALVAHVYAACRKEGIPELAEGLLVSGALDSQESADSRVAQAKEIAGLCMAAKRPDMALELVKAGLSVDRVRARLFDQVVAASANDPINNRAPVTSSAPTQSGPNPQAIYAKRKALSAN